MIDTFNAINLTGVIAETFALGYSAIWALKVHRALPIRAYKNQALGILLVATVLALTQIAVTASAYLVFHNPLDAVGNGGFGLFFIFLVTLFYWVDASIIAFRRSDPQFRDALHWSKLRIALWIGVLPAPILIIPLSILSPLSGTAVASGPPPAWAVWLILFPGIFIPLISGAILLPIIAKRTPDPLLRNHLKWFAVFAAIFLVVNDLLGNQSNLVAALLCVYVGSIAGAYCLYRSVLTLTPLKEIEVQLKRKE